MAAHEETCDDDGFVLRESNQKTTQRNPSPRTKEQEIDGFFLSCSCQGPGCAGTHPAFSHPSNWNFGFYGSGSETYEDVKKDVVMPADKNWLTKTTAFRPLRIVSGAQIPADAQTYKSKIEWAFFERWNSIIDNLPNDTKQHCLPGQVLEKKEGAGLCVKFANLTKVIFLAGPWIAPDEEKRKWLLVDYYQPFLVHIPHEDALQSFRQIQEKKTISHEDWQQYKFEE
jgi:hypothetical protein